MEKLALLLVFPLVWPFVAKMVWKHEITLAEVAINLAVGTLIVVAGWYGGKYSQMHDLEVWNGQVVGKSQDKVSCEHSYSCNCVEKCSGTGKTRSCSTTCDTCYEHSHDFKWNLGTTVGTVEVPRIDKQGKKEPSRWSLARAGDPVAKTEGFTNYVKGAPDSLFNALKDKKSLERFSGKVPAYPLDIHDLHYLNRVLPNGVPVQDVAQWNQDLALLLRELGPAKQVNAVVVFSKESDPELATALRADWLGAKKNDVVLVLGTPDYPNLSWARVVSWTDKELFKVQLRDDLQALKTVDRADVLGLLNKHIRSGFVRKEWKDFEYLMNEIEPPTWLIATLFFASMVASIGVSVFLANNRHRSFGFSGFRSRRRTYGGRF